jgi:hypothetical protein
MAKDSEIENKSKEVELGRISKKASNINGARILNPNIQI